MFSDTCVFGSAFALNHGFLTEIRGKKGAVQTSLPEGEVPEPIYCPNWGAATMK